MSFVMLTESQVVPPAIAKPAEDTIEQDDGLADNHEHEGKAVSQEMERVTRLFEVLSARSDIDHPICVECTELLVDGLQHRLEAATRERDAYAGFLKQVNTDAPTEDEVRESVEKLAQARVDEAAAITELSRLEDEKADIDTEIATLEAEALALDAEEEAFWRSRNAFTSKLSAFQESRDSINAQFDGDAAQLSKLQRSNVYNDTFCISHDGKFGTINGLRLGRLASVPVDWAEINAAWGHALLLLSTVAARMGFDFDGYELQPMGSTSRIIRYDYASPNASRISNTNSTQTQTSAPRPSRPPKKSILELHSSGDMPLGLTFMHRRFDIAMVAFIECLRQLGAYVEASPSTGGPTGGHSDRSSRGPSQVSLPYTIKDDKIGDVSIKLGIAQDDAWSRACKYTLTCCKFLLAHASNVGVDVGPVQMVGIGRGGEGER